MTIAQLEQRLETLEKTLARLQAQLRAKAVILPEEDEIIEGAEYALTPVLRSHAESQFQAKIAKGEKAILGLGLSNEEWAALPLEDEDE